MRANIIRLVLASSVVLLTSCANNTLSETDKSYRDMLLSDAEINYFVQISNESNYISIIDELFRKYDPEDVSTLSYLEQTVGAIKLWEHTYPYEPGRMVTLKNLDVSVRDEIIKQKEAEQINLIISKLRKTIPTVSEKILEPLTEQREQQTSSTTKQTIKRLQNQLSVLQLDMSVFNQAQSSKFKQDSDGFNKQLDSSFNKINQDLDQLYSIISK